MLRLSTPRTNNAAAYQISTESGNARQLRSSGSDRLRLPIIRRSTVGSRTFTASGAAVWNDLPAHVTAAPSLAVFRQRLKTFLFSRSYPDIVS